MCRVAVEEGIAPEDALVMATLHGARAHRLLDRGAIAPGYRADLVAARRPRALPPSLRAHGGAVAAATARRAVRRAAEPACARHDALASPVVVRASPGDAGARCA